MSILFSPYSLSGLMLRNRVVMAPMTRARALNDIPDDLTVLYYGQRASAGLIVSEGVPVSIQGRGYLFNPGLYNQEQVEGWKRVTKAVHEEDGKIFAQLWHVGRVSHTTLQPDGGAPVSSSNKVAANSMAYAYDEKHEPTPIQASPPRALTTEEIADVKNDFVQAARRAVEAGFDGVEIHGANGYLFEQFINPTVNDRKDHYGGSIQNRIRLLLETIDAVTKEIGRAKVGVRISPFGRLFDMASFDDEAETWVEVAREIQKRDIAYVHLSDQLTIGAEGMPDGFAKSFRETYQGTLIAAGGFDRESAEGALISGELDLIAFGRPFIANPDLVERMKNGWPLATPDRSTFYGNSGEKGYVDYPVYQPNE
ncbi:2,4-dienoyl-CoA reductase-like NADH-dependent reductase (Old Yellow Enzyme family) [Pseudomonas helmanticensis]|jgi:2,4-dienoyl-CoA reductase-like NADH-dependent reductase (Old Yellow Enzyme family)|uniref:2,4-dienoyl-CoA reductase-like NADH-dependent reductase (Old Yellow Enzyme family) n=1 Tax=Pseudomonas helmanticensis TaxID=1471381 RepID=A0A4R7VJB5_9PSED|nr:alkene reductase [Pseudomonas helmanticensis]TDV49523.1 2,4-dienoyl-CoA reductase-like NADH-dependent reductase (Old Yellow Enzyme family) [Pseudomonas helmanticensis]